MYLISTGVMENVFLALRGGNNRQKSLISYIGILAITGGVLICSELDESEGEGLVTVLVDYWVKKMLKMETCSCLVHATFMTEFRT